MLFFVLSGYVLALSLPNTSLTNTLKAYPRFIIRRVCRIYLPYLAALAFAVGSNFIFSTGGIADLPTWFNATWRVPISPSLVLEHIVFLGSYDHAAFNTTFWSLVHEMRISLVFPVIVLVCSGKWRIAAIYATTFNLAYLVLK